MSSWLRDGSDIYRFPTKHVAETHFLLENVSVSEPSLALLAFTANSAAQSSAQTHIHSAIVVIDTSNNAWHSQVHWLFGTAYLTVKASNGVLEKFGSPYYKYNCVVLFFIYASKSIFS